jgi:hypothetical protein
MDFADYLISKPGDIEVCIQRCGLHLKNLFEFNEVYAAL